MEKSQPKDWKTIFLVAFLGKLVILVLCGFFWFAAIYSVNANIGNLPVSTLVLALCSLTANCLINTQLHRRGKFNGILVASYTSLLAPVVLSGIFQSSATFMVSTGFYVGVIFADIIFLPRVLADRVMETHKARIAAVGILAVIILTAQTAAPVYVYANEILKEKGMPTIEGRASSDSQNPGSLIEHGNVDAETDPMVLNKGDDSAECHSIELPSQDPESEGYNQALSVTSSGAEEPETTEELANPDEASTSKNTTITSIVDICGYSMNLSRQDIYVRGERYIQIECNEMIKAERNTPLVFVKTAVYPFNRLLRLRNIADRSPASSDPMPTYDWDGIEFVKHPGNHTKRVKYDHPNNYDKYYPMETNREYVLEGATKLMYHLSEDRVDDAKSSANILTFIEVLVGIVVALLATPEPIVSKVTACILGVILAIIAALRVSFEVFVNDYLQTELHDGWIYTWDCTLVWVLRTFWLSFGALRDWAWLAGIALKPVGFPDVDARTNGVDRLYYDFNLYLMQPGSGYDVYRFYYDEATGNVVLEYIRTEFHPLIAFTKAYLR